MAVTNTSFAAYVTETQVVKQSLMLCKTCRISDRSCIFVMKHASAAVLTVACSTLHQSLRAEGYGFFTLPAPYAQLRLLLVNVVCVARSVHCVLPLLIHSSYMQQADLLCS